jgi:hypothetical protein
MRRFLLHAFRWRLLRKLCRLFGWTVLGSRHVAILEKMDHAIFIEPDRIAKIDMSRMFNPDERELLNRFSAPRHG